MLQKMRVLLLVCISAVLVACGSGGGGDADAADKYVGTWKGCWPYFNTADGWGKYTVAINKTSAKTFNYLESYENSYTDSACSNLKGTGTGSSPFAVTLVGAGTVEGKTVDKAISVGSKNTVKTILYRDGNTLYTGGYGAIDAEGFATTLGTPLFKQ